MDILTDRAAHSGEGILDSGETDRLCMNVKAAGWDEGLKRFIGTIPYRKLILLSSIIRDKQAGWRFLFDSCDKEAALIYDTTFGTVTETFARYCRAVYAINSDRRILECIKERLKNKGIENVTLLQVNEAGHLPFKDGLFDLIIFHDMDCTFDPAGDQAMRPRQELEGLIGEAGRVLHASGSLFFSLRNKLGYNRLTKRLSDDFSGYLSRSAKARFSFNGIKRAFKNAGFRETRYYSVYPSLVNIKEIVRIDSPVKQTKQSRIKNSVKDFFLRNGNFTPSFFILASRKPYKSLLDGLMEREINGGATIQRYIVSGRHVIVLCGNSGTENGENAVVIKIPFAGTDVIFCKRNFNALKRLAQVACPIASVIPKPVREGVYEGQPFFIEKKVGGLAVDEPCKGFEQAFPKIIEFLIDFHIRTSKKTIIDGAFFEKLFSSRFQRLKCILSDVHHDALDSLEKYIATRFCGRELPVVVQHGDLKLENVLIDPVTSSIRHIIDWDLSEEGLPVLDLLHLLASRRRVLERKRLEDIIADIIIPLRFDKWESDVLDRYFYALALDKDLLAAFAILYWLHHINERSRFDLIKWHTVWIEGNVLVPLRLATSLYING